MSCSNPQIQEFKLNQPSWKYITVEEACQQILGVTPSRKQMVRWISWQATNSAVQANDGRCLLLKTVSHGPTFEERAKFKTTLEWFQSFVDATGLTAEDVETA